MLWRGLEVGGPGAAGEEKGGERGRRECGLPRLFSSSSPPGPGYCMYLHLGRYDYHQNRTPLNCPAPGECLPVPMRPGCASQPQTTNG